MRKIIVLFLLHSIYFSAHCQDISGLWLWNDSDSMFNIEIEQETSSSYTGVHSSTFHNGSKIDVFFDEPSIFLTEVSTNIYEGTIKSSFSFNTYQVKVTYDPTTNSIEWNLYGEITGIFYFPRKVTMVRLGSENRLIGHMESVDDPNCI